MAKLNPARVKPAKIRGITYRPRHAWQPWYEREIREHASKLALPTSAIERAAMFPANGVHARLIGGNMAGGNLAEICHYVAALLPVECAGEYQVKIRVDRTSDGTPTHFVFGRPSYRERSYCDRYDGGTRTFAEEIRGTFNELFSVPIPPHVWGSPCGLVEQGDLTLAA
jgi:hypothetical protein